MNPLAYRPKRRVRNELFPLFVVAALPTALVLAIPREAIGFLPKSDLPPISPSCAFVTLSEANESKALAAAQSAWHVSPRGVRELRIEMFADSPPVREPTEMLAISSRTRSPEPDPPAFEPAAVPKTLAAPAPTKIPTEPENAAAAFSRDDLLRID